MRARRVRDRNLCYERAQRTIRSANVRSHQLYPKHKPGLGRREPQLAPPAPDAGRGVAKRRRDRRAEVRRRPPSLKPTTNDALQRKNRSENPTGARTNRNANSDLLEVGLQCCDSSQSGSQPAQS